MDMPKELELLLSCCLCRRRFDVVHLQPKILDCQHAYCDDCVTTERVLKSTTKQEVICPKCGLYTKIKPDSKLPEAEALMFLLKEMPALQLGRAMLIQNGGGAGIEEANGDQVSDNSREQVCVESFLVNAKEHCLIHDMPNLIWCHQCQRLMCRACSDSLDHVEHHSDFEELLGQLFSNECAKIEQSCEQATALASRELSMMRQLYEACHHVQLRIKREILEHKPSLMAHQMSDWKLRAEQDIKRIEGRLNSTEILGLLGQLNKKSKIFQEQLNNIHNQCRFKSVIYENGLQLLDFNQLNRRLLRPLSAIPSVVEPPPALILTNYCIFSYWCELQRELIPQGYQAVVPPDFNYCQRNREVRRQLLLEHPRQERELPHHSRYYALLEDFNANEANSVTSPSTSPSWRHPPNVNSRMNVESNWNSPYRALSRAGQQPHNSNNRVSLTRPPQVRRHSIYFLDMEVAGRMTGRVLIEVRPDVAPLMSENFRSLILHERGFGYRGCSVFQAWGNESIITGDFESHNGRGGHAAFESRYFMPDNTELIAHRGTVGMRRGQRRYDSSEFVGSQFRLVLNEMHSFTAIFGYIIRGIEVVDRIAETGDATGRPAVRCILKNCGEYRSAV